MEKNYFVEIENSYEVVAAFFNNDILRIKTFLQLVKYAHAIDKEIAVRYNESIIGASKIDSVFYFYIVNLDGDFLIKYKHLPDRIPFSIIADSFSAMKKECRNAIDYVKEKDISNITPVKTKNDHHSPEFRPASKIVGQPTTPPSNTDCSSQYGTIREADKEFRQYYGFFEDHKDTAIKNCPFPNRVINALARREITTLGDLIGVSIMDLSKTRWMGQKSISSILLICREMCEDPEIVASKEGQKPTQSTENDEWKSVRASVLKAIESGDNTINLEFEERVIERSTQFQKDIELQLKAIAESMEKLTEREKDVFVRYIVLDETYGAIGNDYGVTRERIRQIKNKVIKKIRRTIFRHNVKAEVIDCITHLFLNADREELCWYLSYLKSNRKNTWECISPIISEKSDAERINHAIDNYRVDMRVLYKNLSTKGKKKFYITKEEKENVHISTLSLPITTIVRNINNSINNSKVKKLSYESVLKWLVAEGYIYEERTQNQIIRHPTNKGIENRIIIDEKESPTKGVYYITYYPPSIQRLIVEHANEMV